MSIKIHSNEKFEIFASCTEPGCDWATMNQRDSIEGVTQLHTWHSVHRIKDHDSSPEIEFGPEDRDFNGHTPHMVTGQDFTESPKGEGELNPIEVRTLKLVSDIIRVKTMRIKQLEKDAVERETLITEMRQTIQELLETPDPMPLCKSLEGHNYVPLDQMYVFCTKCGHSIHYKTK